MFKITPSGALSTLYSFTGGDHGNWPVAGLVQGSDGDFYGTTDLGGDGGGTVFKISATGSLNTLYSFTGGVDGGHPQVALVQGSDGNFYGTTVNGGKNGWGTFFKISSGGDLTTLYSFTGARLVAGLVQGSDGNFYGATVNGGTNGGGTVFKITASGALTTLYSFSNPDYEANPHAALVQGSDGDFYGTTFSTVFKISASGALTTLYSFTSDGANPNGLLQGSDGNFYGTTQGGGSNNLGTVFKISANGALTTLYSFTGGADGWDPASTLMQGSDGDFYGRTVSTAFKISSSGALTTLVNVGDDGGLPPGALVQGTDGNLYGTTFGDFADPRSGLSPPPGYGTVFKLSPGGALTNVYSFTGGDDGAGPTGALVQGSDGIFYGTTGWGGANGSGTVFKISPGGALTALYSFTGGDDGGNPLAGLVQGSDGNFYGTTSGWNFGSGTLFTISPGGALTTLYSFTGGVDGENPNGLVQGSDGNFYGTTANGGAGGNGVAFRISVEPGGSSANFDLAVRASPNAGGTVSGGGSFSEGTWKTVTAMANPGYFFANWTQNGIVVSSSASYTLTLATNVALVANFTAWSLTLAQAPNQPGQVLLQFTAPTGIYTVLSSTNLALPLSGWEVLGTASSVGSNFFEFAADSLNAPQRFFYILPYSGIGR